MKDADIKSLFKEVYDPYIASNTTSGPTFREMWNKAQRAHEMRHEARTLWTDFIQVVLANRLKLATVAGALLLAFTGTYYLQQKNEYKMATAIMHNRVLLANLELFETLDDVDLSEADWDVLLTGDADHV